MSKKAVFTVLVLVCCVAVLQGLPTSPRGRCFCKTSGVLFMNMDRVVKVEYHRSSSSCEQEEVLLFLRNNRRRCLNLNGDQGRRIKLAILEEDIANQRSSS